MESTMRVTHGLNVPHPELAVRLVGWGEDYVLLETSACPECQHTGCVHWDQSSHNLASILKDRNIKVVVIANDGSCGDYPRWNRLVIRRVEEALQVFREPAPRTFSEVWGRYGAIVKGKPTSYTPEEIEAMLGKWLREILSSE